MQDRAVTVLRKKNVQFGHMSSVIQYHCNLLQFSGGLCEAELHACISLLNIRILVAHYCAVDTLKEPAKLNDGSNAELPVKA